MIERWKDIPGYDGKYQASTEGNIRRTLKSDHINNIAYIPRQELGKLTGYSSRNKIVVKLDSCGQDVEYYRSAREAAKKNFLSRQAITDRCNGKTKRGPAPDGYEYAWDNSEASRRKAIRRLELAGGYTPMPTAPAVEFEF